MKMGKQVPKMSARVVNAIRNLREAHGSTSKEIMNYIMSQYSASETTVQRQMQAALKRGLDYGILKKNNGHYFLNTEADVSQIAPVLAPVERSRRRRRRKSSRRRRGRRRRRSRGRKRRGGRRRRRSRRRSRRGRRRPMKTRRMGCTRCRCTTKRARDMQELNNDPVGQQNQEEDVCLCEKDSDVDRRSKHSKSRDRSLSRSRSSANSDRDDVDDRQAIQDQD